MAATTKTKRPVAPVVVKGMTALQLAVDLAEHMQGPLSVSELAMCVANDPRCTLKGKTPTATIQAHIYTAAKKGIFFKKAGRGQVELLAKPKAGRS